MTELPTRLRGQAVAVHPAYDRDFDDFTGAGTDNEARRMGPS